MKASPRLLLLFLTACLGWQCTHHPKIAAVHPEKWPEIEAYIKRSWPDYVESKAPLPKPYLYGLNPGTLYYWDVYFHNEGLMRSGYRDIAQNNLDCLIFEIDSLGFVPTAILWGTNRSQLPFLSHSVRRFYETGQPRDTAWLRTAYHAVLREYEFWTNTNGNQIEDHTTPIAGLQRYGHHADSAELIEFYDRVLVPRFPIQKDVPVEEKLAMADQMMAETECQDFTPRFGGHCKEFIPICLNSYLYGYEKDLAFYERELGIRSDYRWEERAVTRAALIEQYCWSEERGLYLDYDYVHGCHSAVASMAGVMPLFFGMSSADHAARVRDNMVLFDSAGGLVSCEVTPNGEQYQFGHNSVWPPTQQLGMEAMERYGFHDQAEQIAMKWLNVATQNYIDPLPATYPPFKYGDGTRHPGFLYEKYTRQGQINDIEYSASPMLGWAGTVFLVSLETVRK